MSRPVIRGFMRGLAAALFVQLIGLNAGGAMAQTPVCGDGPGAMRCVLASGQAHTGDAEVTLQSATTIVAPATAPDLEIRGNGTLVVAGGNSHSPANHTDFGTQRINTPALPRDHVFTVHNIGNAPLNLSGTSVFGTDAAFFSVVVPPPATLAPSASGSFTVRFAPTALGTFYAGIGVQSSDPDTPDYMFGVTGGANNFQPTADAGVDQSVASGVGVFLDGSGSSDPDAGQTLTYSWAQTGGTGIVLTGANTATPDFTAPSLLAGDTNAVLTFQLTVDDGFATDTDTVEITVQAPAAEPEINVTGNGVTIVSGDGDPGVADHTDFGTVYAGGGTIQRVFTIENSGSAPLLISGAALTGGGRADFAIIGVVPSSVAPSGSATITVEYAPSIANFYGSRGAFLTITNNDANEGSYNFAIWGVPGNTSPGADAGPDRTVASGASISLNGSASASRNNDEPLQPYTVAWSSIGPMAGSLDDPAIATPTYTAPTLNPGDPDVTVTLRMAVNDGIVSGSDQMIVTVTAPAATPDIAVESGNGTPISDGQTTTSFADSTNYGTLPLTDAGQQTFHNFVITNTGSGPLTISNVTLSNGDTTAFFFGAAANHTNRVVAPGGTYTISPYFRPSVTALSEVTVTIFSDDPDTPAFDFRLSGSGYNTQPTADAGPDQTVASGAAVTLDGSGSSANDANQTLTHAWVQTAGPAVTLDDDTAATPGFTAPTVAPGDADVLLTFQLTVSDGVPDATGTHTDSVTITVSAPAGAPNIAVSYQGMPIADGQVATSAADGTDFGTFVAMANPWGGIHGFTVTNTGTADLDISSVTLSNGDTGQFSGPGWPPSLTPGQSTTLNLRYQPTMTGTHGVTFTVFTDDPDTPDFDFRVSATGTNTPPTADAGPDQTVASGAAVTLDGSGSDTNDTGQILWYAWQQTAGPSVTLSSSTVANPSFTAPTLAPGDAPVTLTFELTANDQVLDATGTRTDSVTITVTPPGLPAEIEVRGNGIRIANNTATSDVATGTDFGIAARNGPAVRRDFVISNPGDAVLTITTAAASATPNGAFTIRNATPFQVAAGGSETLTIEAQIGNTAYIESYIGLGSDAASDPLFQFVVSMTGNTAPSADAGPDQTVASGAGVTLDGSASDANDPGQSLTYAWVQTAGPTVTLDDASAAGPGFTAPTLANGDPDATLTFQLTVDDGVETAQDSVTVTVQAPAATPDISVEGGGQPIAHGDTTPSIGDHTVFAAVYARGGGSSRSYTIRNPGTGALTLSGIDLSGANAREFTVAGVVPATIAAGGQASVTIDFAPLGTGTRTATLTINSNDGDTPAYSFAVQGEGTNLPPTADAGADLVVTSGAMITLTGTARSAADVSEEPQQNVTAIWSVPINIALAGPGIAVNTVTFTAPFVNPGEPDVMRTYRLTADDGITTVSDEVTVTITALAPALVVRGWRNAVIANGETAVSEDAGTHLGSAAALSGAYNQRVFYLENAGDAPLSVTNLAFSGPGASAFSVAVPPPASIPAGQTSSFVLQFQPNAAGVLDAVMTVSSNDPDAAAYSFALRGEGTNTAPSADAGPDQTVASGAGVTLDGSASDANDPGQSLTYAWVQTAGPSVTLDDASAAGPGFTAPALAIGDADAVLSFELTVDDGVETAQDTVQITVTAPGNTAPSADAGPDQTVASGASVTLDGSGSDANDPGQSLTYAWVQTAGPSVTLDDASAAGPGFTAPALAIGDADAVLSFELTVDDGVETAQDTVQITVTAPGNTAPSADAGPDQTVASGAGVTLDGSASDANDPGQSLTYAWVQTAGPSVTLDDASAAGPGFTAPVLAIGDPDAVLSFELTVDDGVETAQDTVQITVTARTDVTPPGVTLAGAPQSVRSGDSFALSVTFTEPVIGFAPADISVSNGRVLALTGAGADYAATIEADGRGALSVSVPPAVATDLAGNPNTGSGVTVVTDTTVEETQQQMASFMQARASRLIGNQPDLIALYRQTGSGTFNAQATRGQGSLSFATRPDSPIWAQLSAAWSESGTAQDRYAHLALGRHLAMTPTLSFGGMLQVDHIGYTDGLASVRGTGWLVGPYLVGRHPEHPLYFSARALVGQTWNRHSPFGTYTDRVETRRALLAVTVAGDTPWGRATLTPSLRASYTTDRQRAYTDALGNPIAAQSVSMADLAFGLDAALPVTVERGELTLRGGVSLVYSQSWGTGVAATVVPATEGGRGSLRMGFDYLSESGGEWAFDLTYDGLGATAYRSYGLDLSYRRRW